jgi:hypothetical protein
MNQRKIIFISAIPITIKLRELFFLDIFEENGFEVKCWNLQPFCNPTLRIPDELTSPSILSFSSLEEMEKELIQQNPKDTIILSGLDDDYSYRKIFRVLTKHQFILTTIFPYGGIYGFRFLFKDKILRIFSSNILKKFNGLFKSKYYSLYKRMYHINLSTHYFSSSYPHSVAINHPDYEGYAKIKNSNELIIQNEPYIVFLDTYIPLHPDLKRFNALKYVSPEHYQSSLRDFFDKVEEKFQAKVVIAAHPKAVYENNEFGNRQIIKYKTNLLVKEAKLVITHMSNSNSFVMLFNKPVVFITTSEINKIPKFAFVLHCYAKHLNKSVFNIDKWDIEQMDFSRIEDEYRKKYIYSYLSSPETENLSNKEILIKEYSILFEDLKKDKD